MEIFIGTYEQFIIGYELKCIEGRYELSQTVATHAHNASVRGIASSSKFVASGSNDEVIRIFNIAKRTDVGTLIQHSGSITQLDFYGSSHLFTSSEDGTICIWQTHNWNCEKTLRGHKDAVNSISIHPSGKLLLSVSKDKTLRTWNLIKGRCAYVTNLKSIAHFVEWCPSCTLFAVAIDNRIDIYDITIGGVVHTFQFGKRVNCIAFINNDIMVIGGDSNDIQLYSIETKSIINTFNAHSNRLKAFRCVKNCTYIKDNKIWIVSTSSDGYIKIWEFDESQLNLDPTLIASVDTACRPTCLAVCISDEIQNEFNASDLNSGQENANKVSKKRKNKSKENNSNKKALNETVK